MSDISAAPNDRILRFHAPDKVFHSVNAITWFALLFTGMYVYFCNPSDEAAETAMIAHLIIGAVFTFNLLGFIVIAPDRFALIMRACMEWDSNTSATIPAASSASRSGRKRFPRRAATTAARRPPICSSWA